MSFEFIGFLYTILITAAGVIGVMEFLSAGLVGAKAGSSAICLIFAPFSAFGFLTSNYYVLTIVSFVLGCIMTVLYIQSKKFMLSGLVLLLCLCMLIRCAIFFTNRNTVNIDFE